MQFLSSKYFTTCFPVLELCSVVNFVICGLVVGGSPDNENSLEASGRGLVEEMYGHLPGENGERHGTGHPVFRPSFERGTSRFQMKSVTT
jgi:hypothetical protein